MFQAWHEGCFGAMVGRSNLAGGGSDARVALDADGVLRIELRVEDLRVWRGLLDDIAARYRPVPSRVLIDRRQLRDYALDPGDIQKLIGWTAGLLSPPTRIAKVTTDPAERPVGRLFNSLIGRLGAYEFKTFDNEADALAWLRALA